MAQTKRHLVEKTIIRVLADYGFDSESAKPIASKIASEIYLLIPARVAPSGQTDKIASEVSDEIVLFKNITGYFPPAVAREEIERLMQGKTEADLRSAYSDWCFKGNNKNSATWLKWANGTKRRDGALVVK